jgi:PadR family transcriptional regulator, regulatory protein PadR
VINFGSKSALLQALIQGPSYGLELIERIKESSNGAIKIVQGSVYPTLRYMEEEGLVESYESEPLAIRGGRPRVYYRITAKGMRVAQKEANDVYSLLKPALGEA